MLTHRGWIVRTPTHWRDSQWILRHQSDEWNVLIGKKKKSIDDRCLLSVCLKLTQEQKDSSSEKSKLVLVCWTLIELVLQRARVFVWTSDQVSVAYLINYDEKIEEIRLISATQSDDQERHVDRLEKIFLRNFLEALMIEICLCFSHQDRKSVV